LPTSLARYISLSTRPAAVPVLFLMSRSFSIVCQCRLLARLIFCFLPQSPGASSTGRAHWRAAPEQGIERIAQTLSAAAVVVDESHLRGRAPTGRRRSSPTRQPELTSCPSSVFPVMRVHERAPALLRMNVKPWPHSRPDGRSRCVESRNRFARMAAVRDRRLCTRIIPGDRAAGALAAQAICEACIATA